MPIVFPVDVPENSRNIVNKQRKYRNFLGKDPRAASRPFYFFYKLHNILRCLKVEI